jgi:hypothetical protein
MNKLTFFITTLLVGMGIYLVSIIFYLHTSSDTFAQWVSTLSGTLVGALLAAIIGVGLFYYQGNKTEERRRHQLLEAWAGELQATLDTLESEPDFTIPPPEDGSEGEEEVAIRLAHLEPIACEEAIRNAVFGARDTMALSQFAMQMRYYNADRELMYRIYAETSTPDWEQRIFDAAKNLKGRQDYVVMLCKQNIEWLEEIGIDIPPRIWSRNRE